MVDQNGCVFFSQKTAAYMEGARNNFVSDSKISFFGTRGVFFPDLSVFSKFTESFQNFLSTLDHWEKLITYSFF